MDVHLFLVLLFVLAVLRYLILDFLAHFLVFLDFLGACLLEIVDLLSHFSHSLLEVLSQVRSHLSLIIQHLFMLQVQVMVLLED